MIKRYDVSSNRTKVRLGNGQTINGIGFGSKAIESETGEWVKYEDYQKEVDDLRLINDKLLALNKEYKKL